MLLRQRLFSLGVILATAAWGQNLGLRAASADPLRTLLANAGGRVEQFWEQFTSVSCIETVSQTKLTRESKVISQKKERYQYLILLQISGDQITVDESRELQGNAAKQPSRTLLSTDGFSVLALIFHPFYQSSFLFRELPSERPDERLVEFEAVRGARSPSALGLKGKTFPIEWRGAAVLGRSDGILRRIRVGLAAPMADLGLEQLRAEVIYTPVAFRNPPQDSWLPQSATIEAATRRQHWRNLHQFSDYRRFSVSTNIQIGEPK
jgi:hypothetical protein